MSTYEKYSPTQACNQLYDFVFIRNSCELSRRSAIYRARCEHRFKHVFHDTHTFFFIQTNEMDKTFLPVLDAERTTICFLYDALHPETFLRLRLIQYLILSVTVPLKPKYYNGDTASRKNYWYRGSTYPDEHINKSLNWLNTQILFILDKCTVSTRFRKHRNSLQKFIIIML